MRYLAVLLVLLAACDGQADFRSGEWREADLTTRDRAPMARGLVASDRLKGLDRAGVIRLLGAPTATDKWRDADLVYRLGPEAGMVSIDHEWLVIDLDAKGRVSGSRIVED